MIRRVTESAASADENTKRMFTCDCCESCDLATETYDGNLPARYMDRFKKFWSDEREQANHPVIAFEYRSECAKYRTAMAHRDDPAHSWYTQDMPVLLKHLASRHPNDGPIPEDWETDTLDGESKGSGGSKRGERPARVSVRRRRGISVGTLRPVRDDHAVADDADRVVTDAAEAHGAR